KSTERSFRSYIPRAQPHYLSQFFPTQPEMAVYGYPIGQVSHEVFYLRNVDLKSPLSERHPKPSFYHGPIQRCSFSCQRRETIFPCRYHEGSFGRSEIPFIQIFLRQNRRQALSTDHALPGILFNPLRKRDSFDPGCRHSPIFKSKHI